MSKDKLVDYDSTASGNLDVGGVSVAEGMLPSNVNNAIREQMSHLKDFADGTEAINALAVDNLKMDGNTISSTDTNGDIILDPDGTGKVDINGNLDVDGGTIKLDGNYPTGTNNVALGDAALDDGSLSGGNNTAVGYNSATSNTTGEFNSSYGASSLGTNSTGVRNTAIGTNALLSNSTGSYNSALGMQALSSNTTTSNNTAVGHQALYTNAQNFNVGLGHVAGYANTTGYITAIGSAALQYNTTGTNNVAVGGYNNAVATLRNNTTGSQNTGVGYGALVNNTTANNNTAVGKDAMYANTTGTENVGIGKDALASNTTGVESTAVGYQAGFLNTTGRIVAVGRHALRSNTTAVENTGIGYRALRDNTTGANNTALGGDALISNTTASNNTVVGYQAGYGNTTGATNVFVGQTAGYNNTTGYTNTFIGYNSGSQITTGAKNTILGRYNGNQGGLDIRTSSNNIVLSDGDGNPRAYFDSNGNLQLGYGGQTVTAFAAPQGITIGSLDNVALQYYLRKGNQVEAHIGFKSSTDSNFYVGTGGGAGPGGIGASGVYLTNLGTSWNAVSDETQKTIVEDIEGASEKVSTLRTVMGHYNNDENETRRPFLIAQDVQAVLPEAVSVADIETGVLGLSYTDVIPLLTAAIKEQRTMIQELEARIAALESN